MYADPQAWVHCDRGQLVRRGRWGASWFMIGIGLTPMLTLLLLPCLLADAPVPPEAPDDRQSEEIRLEITTTAWFPRLVGSYSFGPNGTSLDVETDTNLHSSEVGFMGELGFRAEAWEFRLIGSTFETSGEGRLNAPARVAGVDLPAQAAWASTYSQWMIRPELDVAIVSCNTFTVVLVKSNSII